MFYTHRDIMCLPVLNEHCPIKRWKGLDVVLCVMKLVMLVLFVVMTQINDMRLCCRTEELHVFCCQ